MDKIVADLSAYFSTNGTFADAVYFANLVASRSWNEIIHLKNIVGL